MASATTTIAGHPASPLPSILRPLIVNHKVVSFRFFQGERSAERSLLKKKEKGVRIACLHMFPVGRRFGRNSAPAVGFSVIFRPIGTAFALRNFRTFALLMVQPPAAAIRDLLEFWGSGALRQILRMPGAQNGPKTPKKWIFPVLGAVLGETPASQI